MADIFLEEAAARLTPAEREFLERLSNASLRLYEVESVRARRGRAPDRSVDRHAAVRHRADGHRGAWSRGTCSARASRPTAWAATSSRAACYLYPAESKDEVLQHFRRLYRRHHRKFPLDDATTFFRRHGIVFHHLWLRLVAFPEPPEVGDLRTAIRWCSAARSSTPTSPTRSARFCRHSRRSVPADDGTLGWLETNGAAECEVGTWSIEGKRVLFETNSQERAHARPRLARGARRRSRALPRDGTRDHRADHERAAAAAAEVRGGAGARRSRRCTRTEPSASSTIGTTTPGSTVRCPPSPTALPAPRRVRGCWRRKVIDLLKGLENMTARGALHGRPPYDFQWIWRELELSRPGSESSSFQFSAFPVRAQVVGPGLDLALEPATGN